MKSLKMDGTLYSKALNDSIKRQVKLSAHKKRTRRRKQISSIENLLLNGVFFDDGARSFGTRTHESVIYRLLEHLLLEHLTRLRGRIIKRININC